jgi:hypothetical protein
MCRGRILGLSLQAEVAVLGSRERRIDRGVHAHRLVLRRAMSRMYGSPERRRTALRGAGAGGSGGIAQDALSNLLFSRHAWVSILPRWSWLRARRVGRGVRLLVWSRRTYATLGRASKGSALLLVNRRGGGQSRVVLEDVGPVVFLSWQRHLERFDGGMLQMAG